MPMAVAAFICRLDRLGSSNLQRAASAAVAATPVSCGTGPGTRAPAGAPCASCLRCSRASTRTPTRDAAHEIDDLQSRTVSATSSETLRRPRGRERDDGVGVGLDGDDQVGVEMSCSVPVSRACAAVIIGLPPSVMSRRAGRRRRASLAAAPRVSTGLIGSTAPASGASASAVGDHARVGVIAALGGDHRATSRWQGRRLTCSSSPRDRLRRSLARRGADLLGARSSASGPERAAEALQAALVGERRERDVAGRHLLLVGRRRRVLVEVVDGAVCRRPRRWPSRGDLGCRCRSCPARRS